MTASELFEAIENVPFNYNVEFGIDVKSNYKWTPKPKFLVDSESDDWTRTIVLRAQETDRKPYDVFQDHIKCAGFLKQALWLTKDDFHVTLTSDGNAESMLEDVQVDEDHETVLLEFGEPAYMD